MCILGTERPRGQEGRRNRSSKHGCGSRHHDVQWRSCLRNGPDAELSKELRQRGGQVVHVQAAGVGENPRVTAAEEVLLEADAGVFDAGDDAVGADADEGDEGWGASV